MATVSDDVNDMINLLDVTVSLSFTSCIFIFFCNFCNLIMPDAWVVSSVGFPHPGAFGNYLTFLEDG